MRRYTLPAGFRRVESQRHNSNWEVFDKKTHMKHSYLLLGLLGALACMAAPIDGKWTVSVTGRSGAQMQTLTLKLNGSELTGSFDSGRGASNIAEGKIEGSDVSFKVTRVGRNGNTSTTYSGKLSGDDLKLTATRQGGGGAGGKGAQELDFKRAN